MKMKQAERSETSAYKFRTSRNHQKSIQHSEQGCSLKLSKTIA